MIQKMGDVSTEGRTDGTSRKENVGRRCEAIARRRRLAVIQKFAGEQRFKRYTSLRKNVFKHIHFRHASSPRI